MRSTYKTESKNSELHQELSKKSLSIKSERNRKQGKIIANNRLNLKEPSLVALEGTWPGTYGGDNPA